MCVEGCGGGGGGAREDCGEEIALSSFYYDISCWGDLTLCFDHRPTSRPKDPRPKHRLISRIEQRA